MPRHFFHIRDREQLIEDQEGVELADLHAVLDEALRIDREFGTEGTGIFGMEMEITDAAGRTVLKVPIQERRRNRSLPPSAATAGDQRISR
jgi:hypothetical protein